MFQIVLFVGDSECNKPTMMFGLHENKFSCKVNKSTGQQSRVVARLTSCNGAGSEIHVPKGKS